MDSCEFCLLPTTESSTSMVEYRKTSSVHFGHSTGKYTNFFFTNLPIRTLSTRVIFVMPLLFDMVGLLRIILQVVPVIGPTTLNMLSVVRMELSLLSATMTSGI